MDFYHGTIVGGLTELKPFNAPYSNIDKEIVYLTTSKQLAVHYIWDTKRCPVRNPMLDIRKDGTLVFQEMFSGALAYFYKGLSGYVYRCVGDYPLSAESGIFSCAASEETVSVMDVDFIEDVYEKIMEYGRYGTFIYEKYEDLPRYRYDIIRGIVMRNIKENDLLNNPFHKDYQFTKEKYPRYWKEAEVLYEHGLM
jgi:hypothetical protein